MAKLSKIEYNNGGRGFIEEIALVSLVYEASLYGFIRTVTFHVANPRRSRPSIGTGTQTGSTSSTILIDSAADFFRALVHPGDRVINTTDGDAVWEVATRDSKTQLTVQLVASSGGDDDFAASDAYRVERRNLEDAYIPDFTEIRITGREVEKVFLRGVVQEAIPGDGQGRALKIIAVSHEVELRDSSAQTDTPEVTTGVGFARSEVLQVRLNDSATGSEFLFPKVSNWEGTPGIEHTPNKGTVLPDFSKTSRSLLASMLDFAKSEQWCSDALLEPSQPIEAFAGVQTGTEELKVGAQGSLAQSFNLADLLATPAFERAASVSSIGLTLSESGSPTGNLYIRLESSYEDGTVDASRNDIPSGELVAPWAESNLINITNVVDVGGTPAGAILTFDFDHPVPILAAVKYWIVLSYQENAGTIVVGVDFVQWHLRDIATLYSPGTAALYVSNVWTVPADEDFLFEINEHSNALYHYDTSGATWEDQTTEALVTGGASTLRWFGKLSGADLGNIKDRYYMRFAGPIAGLRVIVDTASADGTPALDNYGVHTFTYFGDDGAEITGEHEGAANALVLTDTDKDFRRSAVAIGDVLHNKVDGSFGIVTAFTETTITVADLQGVDTPSSPIASDETFEAGDTYAIINLEQRLTGSHTGGASATVLTVVGADFERDGVREGDLIVNVTKNLVAPLISFTATTITNDAINDLDWATSDTFKVLSRWRTLTLISDTAIFNVATDLGGTSPVPATEFEWEIPSNWIPTFLEADRPEAATPVFGNLGQMRGFWLSIQVASIPSTEALVDELIPIPGAGFGLEVTDTTHEDVIFVGATHDGLANATDLRDSSEDFLNNNLVQVGDIVENLTDGSRGTITAIVTDPLATTLVNDTIVAALAGGTDDDWDISDEYRILRERFRTCWFRVGSRPLGLPANFGLTLRSNSTYSKQIMPLETGQFSQSTKSSVNRVRVVGRTIGGAVIDEVVNNFRAQKQIGRVIHRTITDYSIKTTVEALTRADAELARLANRSRRAIARVYTLPFSQKTLERQNWFNSGIGLIHKLDGSAESSTSIYDYSEVASSTTQLVDADTNFKKWGVEVGDLVTNLDDGNSTMIVTAINTTVNENDTLTGVLAGGTNNDWEQNDSYRVERLAFVRVGDIIHVQSGEPNYVDFDFIVVALKYSEPEFVTELRLARSLTAPALGDHMTFEEIIAKMNDDSRMGVQRGSY